MEFTFTRSTGPKGKLADAEVAFTEGQLAGWKLVGFGIWERRSGERYLTLPSRQYTLRDGSAHSYALLRPKSDRVTHEAMRIAILGAFFDFEEQEQQRA